MPDVPRHKTLLRRASVESVMTSVEGCYDSMFPQREDSPAAPPHLPLTMPRSEFPRRRLQRLMSFDDVDSHEDGKMGHVDPISGIKTMLSIAAARAVAGGALPFSDGCHEVSRECVEATLREVALSRALNAGEASPVSRRRAPPLCRTPGTRHLCAPEMVINPQLSTPRSKP